MINFDNFDAKGLLAASRDAIARAYRDADKKARQEEHDRKLAEIFRNAVNNYFDVSSAVAGTVRKNAANLGLHAPGMTEQIMIDNGVDVTENGMPLFGVIVHRRRDNTRSNRELGLAIQDALDGYCYQNCIPRIYLLRMENLGENRLGLMVTVGGI